MFRSWKYPVLAAAIVTITPSLAAASTPDVIGEPQRCVSLTAVREVSVINDHTVLLRMRGAQADKRMDLTEPCKGMQPWGRDFGRIGPALPGALCVEDVLRVRGEIENCRIDKMVNVGKAEAKALLESRP